MTRLATLVLVLLLAACSAASEYAAARDGAAAAEKDIAKGDPQLLFIGMPRLERDIVDAATGLPRYSTGCEYSETQNAYVDGYNDATLEALAAGRLAGLTLAHKLTDYATVHARFESEEPLLLEIDGASIPSPGGGFEIRFARFSDHPDAVRFIYVKDVRTGNEQRTVNPSGDTVPVLFDHAGTTLLVRIEQFDRYVNIDLPRALEMQALVDPERSW